MKYWMDKCKIKIEPIIDIYNFVASNNAKDNTTQNSQNFELIKLLSEGGDVNKVIAGKITSKNYGRHALQISSNTTISNKEVIWKNQLTRERTIISFYCWKNMPPTIR